MNAEQWLEVYRQRAGFDGWEDFYSPEMFSAWGPDCDDGEYPQSPFARPAWRDDDSPGGWFVLPPEFEWDGASGCFFHNTAVLAVVPMNDRDGRYAIWIDSRFYAGYPTAPEAFRAALEYLKSQDEGEL